MIDHNRLRWMKAYLVGPMDHDRNTGREWRQMMADWLRSRGVIPIDPYHKPLASVSDSGLEGDDNYGARQAAIDAGDKFEAARLMKPVRNTDLRIVDETSFQIINLDVEKRPCGTYEECFTGNRQKKPVIVHCPHGIKGVPHWMFSVVPPEQIFFNWEDVKDYLDHIDSAPDEEVDTLNRWVFFDLEDEYEAIASRTDEEWIRLRAEADFVTASQPTG